MMKPERLSFREQDYVPVLAVCCEPVFEAIPC
jgi:hypothetical protein